MSQTPRDPARASKTRPTRRRWWRRVLLPRGTDVLALLVAQGELTVVGLDAFKAWSHGEGAEAAKAIRAADHQAYHARRELLTALQAALSTPLDQEDIYVLSERIDRTLTIARNTVRESEVLGWTPDAHAAQMGDRVAGGAHALVTGFGLLRKAPDEAGRQADLASDTVRRVEHDYRTAMAEVIKLGDLRAVFAAQDIYRRYLAVAESIIAVADRLWFVVLRGA
jgi:uncharacterized protein Yka (UPF0111/DUF47 family)